MKSSVSENWISRGVDLSLAIDCAAPQSTAGSLLPTMNGVPFPPPAVENSLDDRSNVPNCHSSPLVGSDATASEACMMRMKKRIRATVFIRIR